MASELTAEENWSGTDALANGAYRLEFSGLDDAIHF